MCGIAGYYGPTEIPAERIRAALALMRRRGPDAEGHWHHACASGRHVHLLFTRLAIIDLDPRANQPFAFDGGMLSYNGELYNYLELRAAIERAGTKLRTTSDTEVLAHVLAQSGPQGLARCEGMWGLAWFDPTTNRLTLARDRFGEKPVYVYRDGDNLYFGSEVKFLFALMGRRLPVNEEHLKRYLVNGYKALYKTPAAFFHGLESVRRGCWMGIDASGGMAVLAADLPR
jgi:asparagine synthase (glutamine-hydrolysing)